MIQSSAKGLIIAAPSSGSGKTLVTLSLLKALADKGVKVASAKVGPDYIDPAFHAAASGRECVNIDPWAMRHASQLAVKSAICENTDLVICEGVMGLFDGARDGTGATADLAAKFNWPVVMVVDVRGQATSAVASLKGFVDFRKDVNVCAVIFNKVGTNSHVQMLERGMAQYLPDIPILGFLPRKADLVMPERHLGLVQASENKDLAGFLSDAANWVSENVDLTALQNVALENELSGTENHLLLNPLGQRIAIARDEAFAFSYSNLIDSWRYAGAEVSFFSPLKDETPIEGADSIYLPGGYPELHAGKLSSSKHFMESLHRAQVSNIAIFGECGGYMTLGETLTDADGTRHVMAGLLPVHTSFAKRKLHLGYRKAELLADCALGKKGQKFKGHEFHYASIIEEASDGRLFAQTDALDDNLSQVGHVRGNTFGSYLHLIDQADD